MAECCETEYVRSRVTNRNRKTQHRSFQMPYSAGTMQYEFMQDVSPSSSKEESNQTQDVFIKPKCHRRKLTLRNLHLQPESPSELMENLIQKYNLTSTSDQMALFARLRLCVYFGKPEQRKLLIFTRMQALSILCGFFFEYFPLAIVHISQLCQVTRMRSRTSVCRGTSSRSSSTC